MKLLQLFVDEDIIVKKFVARHVKKGKECNVQCMMLWTEWIRFYMRENKRRAFPETYQMREFTELIHDKFGPSLTYDNFRGPVFVGIKFVK